MRGPVPAAGRGRCKGRQPLAIGLVIVSGMLFTLFVLPAVYVAIATDHRANAESDRTREIADFDLGNPALKPT